MFSPVVLDVEGLPGALPGFAGEEHGSGGGEADGVETGGGEGRVGSGDGGDDGGDGGSGGHGERVDNRQHLKFSPVIEDRGAGGRVRAAVGRTAVLRDLGGLQFPVDHSHSGINPLPRFAAREYLVDPDQPDQLLFLPDEIVLGA